MPDIFRTQINFLSYGDHPKLQDVRHCCHIYLGSAIDLYHWQLAPRKPKHHSIRISQLNEILSLLLLCDSEMMQHYFTQNR
jgi:hypothetical protein